MRVVILLLLLGLAAGCATQSSSKPIEFLDERTAMTVGALQEPIELLPTNSSNAARIIGKHVSFAYLGPVEWDRSGQVEYALWVHIAPGNGLDLADIRSPAALSLVLDTGPVALTPIDAPQLGRSAYQPVASWGQTAYFELTVPVLRSMAGSQKLQLQVRASGGATISFLPTADTRAILNDYLQARGITDD